MISFLPISEIRIGAVVLQTWGVFVALGFVSALFLSLREARRRRIEEGAVWDAMIIALLAMIVGGRLLYFCLDADRDVSVLIDPHGGFSLMGGAMAAGALLYLYLARRRQDVGKFMDAMTPGIVVALILVRVGCFLVNDHVGAVTTGPLAVRYIDGTLRHPVALYHILFLVAIYAIIAKVKAKRNRNGYLFFSFCRLYAALGFFADFSRCHDLGVCDPHLYGLTAAQWLLLLFLAASGYIKKRCFDRK